MNVLANLLQSNARSIRQQKQSLSLIRSKTVWLIRNHKHVKFLFPLIVDEMTSSTFSTKADQVVDFLVNDLEGKYDEALVDRFVSVTQCADAQDFHPVQETLRKYAIIDSNLTTEDYKKVNNVRIFKLTRAVFHNRHFRDDVEGLVKLFLARLRFAILDGNSSVLEASLALLNTFVGHSSGYNFLEGQIFKPAVEIPSAVYKKLKRIQTPDGDHQTRAASNIAFKLEDIVDIAQFFLEFAPSYHVENQARELMATIFKRILNENVSKISLIDSLRVVMRDLMSKKIISLYHVMCDVIHDHESNFKKLNRLFDFEILIRQCFEESAKENSKDLIMICRCLASGSSPHLQRGDVETLKKSKNLEAIVTYINNLNGDEINPSLLAYVIYPILISCDSARGRALTAKLISYQDEREFIETHLSSKVTIMCLTHVKKLLSKSLDSKSEINLLDVILEYILCKHSDLKAFKNILESCSILRRASLAELGNNVIFFVSLKNALKDLLKFKVIKSSHDQAVMVELIRLLDASIHSTPAHQEDLEEVMKLAFVYEDHDILNEFASLLLHNQPDYQADARFSEIFVRLIWCHMYPKAIETTHRDFLGNLACLMCQIDMKAADASLAKFNIRRHYHVPIAIGDILVNKQYLFSTIDKIVDNLNEKFITSIVCGDCFEHFLRGLFLTIRGECSDKTRLKVIDTIISVYEFSVIKQQDDIKWLDCFVKANILETIYEIIGGNLYSHADAKGQNISLNSLADQIIMQQTIAAHTSDCY